MTAHIPRLAWGRADGWNGLADGQEWSAKPGTAWQARLDPRGRAHVIGLEVALMDQNPDHIGGGWALGWTGGHRPYHTGTNGYDRAMRAARLHNAMVKAASGNPAHNNQEV